MKHPKLRFDLCHLPSDGRLGLRYDVVFFTTVATTIVYVPMHSRTINTNSRSLSAAPGVDYRVFLSYVACVRLGQEALNRRAALRGAPPGVGGWGKKSQRPGVIERRAA